MPRLRREFHSSISKAKTPAEHQKILATIYQRHGLLLETAMQFREVKLACAAGCSYCCHLKVDVKAHEVIFLSSYLKRVLQDDEIRSLVKRCDEHRQRYMLQTLKEQMVANNACPLLVNGRCSAYLARPFSCRNHHAQAVNPCREAFEKPEMYLTTPGTEDKVVKGIGGIVWMICGEIYSELGFDSRVYDLGCALYEALTNPKCEKRWRDKSTAFSKIAVVKDTIENWKSVP